MLDAKMSPNVRSLSGRPAWHLSTTVGILKLCLEAKADVDGKASDGSTAMHRFAAGGVYEASEALNLLLEAKANINARDLKGQTALMVSASCPVLNQHYYAG